MPDMPDAGFETCTEFTLREFSRYLARRLPPSAASSCEVPGDAASELFGLPGPASAGSTASAVCEIYLCCALPSLNIVHGWHNILQCLAARRTCMVAATPWLWSSGAPAKCRPVCLNGVYWVWHLQ